MIKQVSTKLSNTPSSIPRYLYHLTSKKNYDSILSTGTLRAYHDANSTTNLSGVFMFDLINFIKRWCCAGFTIESANFSLAKALFLKIALQDPNLVLLRVPTKNLSDDKLRCRAQDVYSISEEHNNNGDVATNQKHYTRKKKAIEYIYQENIPIQDVTKIGAISTQIDITKKPDLAFFESFDILELLGGLLENQPEEKAVNLAKKSSFNFIDLEKV